MKIGLTGAHGFVGSNLLRGLSAEHEVHALARRPAADRPLDLLVLAGGLVGGAHSREAYFEANVTNAVSAARAALEMGARRCLLLSTGAAQAPEGDYAESKFEGERAVRKLLPTQVLRLFFPYGPGQQPERLIPRLIARIRNGEPVTEGPRLNPIYIDDLVEVVRRLVVREDELLLDVGGPEVVSIGELALRIGGLLGVTPAVLPAAGPIRDWIADLGAVVGVTGYTPAIDVAEGLRRVIVN